MNPIEVLFFLSMAFAGILWLRSIYHAWLHKHDWWNWYGGVYLKSLHWRLFRTKMLWLTGGKCETCGSRRRLQVHHLNYKHLWNERTKDVKVLCKKCHDWIHQ